VSDRWLRFGQIAVSAVGVALAAYLTYVHYKPAALICTTGGGCETVQQSKYAVLVGIPVAILGLAAWTAALVLAVWDSEPARTLLLAIALVALAFAVYLVVLQLFVIDAICTWCMINDLAVTPSLVVLTLLRLRTAEPKATG